MEQQIRFCTTSDGVRIAYATIGQGPPLVYAAGWTGHLELEWERPYVRSFLESLAAGRTLIRYDMRGSGLSDRDVSDFSLDALGRDLEAVVEHQALDQFALLSLGSLAGPIAIRYAAAATQRVTHLILYSAYRRGADIASPKRQNAIFEYVASFGVPSSELMDHADVDTSQRRDQRELGRESATRDTEVALLKTLYGADSSGLVDRLTMPVLILHGRQDRSIPFALGRDLAAHVPHATFVPFETAGAVWAIADVLIPEIRRFLGVVEAVTPAAPASSSATTSGLVTVLFTDMEGSTTLTQRLGDAAAQAVLRRHNTIIRDALRDYGGAEVKHTGDGIMASFPSASRALECAVTIQKAFAAWNEGTEQVRVRIGLNAGEPVAEDADLFGTAVQLAARVCARAEPGQILVPEGVRHLVAGKGFLFSDRGDVALRGFEDPVRLYEVRW